MDVVALLSELYGRIPPLTEEAVRGSRHRRPRLAAGAGREHDRVARLAPRPRPGPPHRRDRRGRPGVGRGRPGRPVRPRRPTRRTPATATPPRRWRPSDPTAPTRCWTTSRPSIAYPRPAAGADPRRARSRGRPAVGPAGDARRAVGEHRRRLPPTRGPGRLRARSAGTTPAARDRDLSTRCGGWHHRGALTACRHRRRGRHPAPRAAAPRAGGRPGPLRRRRRLLRVGRPGRRTGRRLPDQPRGRAAVRRGGGPGARRAGGGRWARPTRSWWSRPAPVPGTLCRTVLAAAPECAAALRYVLVERSAAQRRLHAERLRLEDPSLAFAPVDPDTEAPVAGAPDRPDLRRACAELPRVAGPGGGAGQRAARQPALRPGRAAGRRVARGAGRPGGRRRRGRGAWSSASCPSAAERRRRSSTGSPPAPPDGARVPLQDAARGLAARARSPWPAPRAGSPSSTTPPPPPTWPPAPRPSGCAPTGPTPGAAARSTTSAARTSPARWPSTSWPWSRPPSSDTQPGRLAAAPRPRRPGGRGRRTWTERAHVGDLAALAARSRVTEAEALTDPSRPRRASGCSSGPEPRGGDPDGIGARRRQARRAGSSSRRRPAPAGRSRRLDAGDDEVDAQRRTRLVVGGLHLADGGHVGNRSASTGTARRVPRRGPHLVADLLGHVARA